MDDAPLETIVEAITADVSLARAWSVLTDEEHVPRWLGCLHYKKMVGHVFYMQPDPQRRDAGEIEGATHCEILALDEPSCFRFSWYLPGTPKTEVTIELKELEPEKTKATLKHSGWDKFQAQEIRQVWEMLKGGWKSAVLPNFKKTAENGD